MHKDGASGVPQEITALVARLSAWRNTKSWRGEAMPSQFWQQAVSLAARHGIGPVARYLSLSQTDLKKHMSGANLGGQPVGRSRIAAKKAQRRQDAAPRFMRLAPIVISPPETGLHRAGIEIENKAGEKLRLDSSGVDVAALIKVFLGGAK